jgi:clostripain
MKRFLGITATLMALSILLTAFQRHVGPPTLRAMNAQANKAKWTILIYADCDCNLESQMIPQFCNLASVGGNADVNVILLVDRSEKGEEAQAGYSNSDMLNIKNWTGAKVFQALKNEFVELADLGEVNMAAPELLSRFVLKGASEFPAEKYALIFGDHGEGWMGLCSDDSHNGDQLTLPRLNAALAAVTKEIGKLEVIGFDACLMADVETAHAVSKHARYMIASQQIESGLGWDFPPVLTALRKNPAMGGKEFGEVVCDTFKEQFDKARDVDLRKLTEGVDVTLSVVDLSKINDLVKAIDGLANQGSEILKDQEEKGWVKLARARSRAEWYGIGGGDSASFQSRDLGHLSDQIRKQDQGAGAACDALDRALQAAVVKRVRGKGAPNSGGLSIYFPRDGRLYSEGYRKVYGATTFGGESQWTEFLKRYVAQADSGDKQPALKDLKVNKEVFSHDDGQKIIVSADIAAPELLDRAQFVVSKKIGKHKVIIGQSDIDPDEDGELRTKWDGCSYYIINGDERMPCPFSSMEELDDEDDVYIVEVLGQVLKKGRNQWIDVTFRFILDLSGEEATGEFVDAVMETKGGVRTLPIKKGDEMRMTYLVVDEKGKEVRLPDSSSLKISKLADLTIGYLPLTKGAYYLGFSVTDLNGNSDVEDHEITVKDNPKN